MTRFTVIDNETGTYQEARQQAIDCWNTRASKERSEDK